jgi:hypothetical protein
MIPFKSLSNFLTDSQMTEVRSAMRIASKGDATSGRVGLLQ